MTRGRRAAGASAMPSQRPQAGSGASERAGALSQATIAVPAAVRASAAFKQTERAFQAQVVRYARLMGWTAWHDHDSRKNAAGLPDLILVRRPRIVWAELKSERGRLRPAQRAWIDELRACGQEVHLWRPSQWREVEEVLR